MVDAQGPGRREEESSLMLAEPPTKLGRQPSSFESAIKIVTQVLDLDNGSRSALRLCSRETRAACDSGVTRLQFLYGSEQPGMRPPSGMEEMQQSVRGLLSRGCIPGRLTLQLDVMSPDREAKGLAVLGVFSDVHSLKVLNLHGLRLNTNIATHIGIAAPGLTKLSLNGASSNRASLAEGLPAVLKVAPKLQELTISILEHAWLAQVGSGEHPAWQALRDHAALTRLQVTFKMGMRIGSELGHRDRVVPDSIIKSVASLVQLRSLSLVIEDDSGMVLPDALSTIAAGLPGLRGLSLRNAGSTDILHRSETRCLEHVSVLCQLTALTHLSLGYPLSISSVQQAINDGTWGLPPRLCELHLDTPLSALQLARLAVPPTLHTVTLGPGAKLQLPARLEEAVEAVAALKPKVVAWRLTHLALCDCKRSLQDPAEHFQWIPQLGPMQLHSLELKNLRLSTRDMTALADALSPTLEELKLERCSLSSLPHTFAALLRLSCLRTLILAGNSTYVTLGWTAAGISRLEGLMLIPRLRSQAALEAQAAAGAGQFNAAAERAEVAVRAMEAAVERLALGKRFKSEEMVALFEAALLVLLSRRVNVQIETTELPLDMIRAASTAVLKANANEGAGAEWGRFELVECSFNGPE